jgi:hypothetical protein
MTHPLRASAVLWILALAVPPYLAHAQVITSHAVPSAFGALGVPSVALTLSSRPGEWASLPERVSVSMRCWNDLLSASDPWRLVSRLESSQRGRAIHRWTRSDGGTSEAFASGVTCTFTTARPSNGAALLPAGR